MIKKFIFAAAFLFAALSQTYAQYQADALLFSQQIYGSTSKSLSMGGALSPVGADLSVMATNPAGLALFNSNQLSFTSNFMLNTAETNFLGNKRSEDRFGYSVDNLAFSFTKRNEGSDWKAVSFGLGYNRLNEYRMDAIASGINNEGSIHDFYVYNANNREATLNPFREELAYEAYLINYDEDKNEYYSFITDAGLYGERQRREDLTRGGKGEFDFSMAANYNDIISLGLTVGTQFLTYDKRMSFSEADYNEVYAMDGEGNQVRMDPETMEFSETLITNGTGINVKAGIIMQPIPLLRLSAAFHTKTLTSFQEEYRTGMSSRFYTPDDNNNYSYFYDSDYNYFDWNLHQPRRFNAGAALILDQYQIGSFYTVPMTFSAEYEYVDYSSMHLKSGAADFDRENDLIETMYKETHNLRGGAEFNFGRLKFRGGYALYPSAYADDTGIMDNARSVYSGGLSFAGKNGYIDLAYSYSLAPQTLYMYDAQIYYPHDPIGDTTEPTAELTKKFQYITVTFGLR